MTLPSPPILIGAGGVLLAGLLYWLWSATQSAPAGAVGPGAPVPAGGKEVLLPMRMIVCPSGTRGQVVNGQFTCVPTAQAGMTAQAAAQLLAHLGAVQAAGALGVG